MAECSQIRSWILTRSILWDSCSATRKAGPFKLEVEWIKVRTSSPDNAAMPLQRDTGYVEAGHERYKLDGYASTEGEHDYVEF